MAQKRQRRKLDYRPNRKVPTVPVNERKIKKIEDLPPQYKRVLDRYPPDVDTETATQIRGLSRSSLYTAAIEGRVAATKDGAAIKWNVLSLLLDLANLPVASFASGPASRGTDVAAPPPITAEPVEPRIEATTP